VLDATRQSGDGGVGTVYRQGVEGPMGRRIPADYEVTGFEPDRLISFKATAGPFRPQGRFQLGPAGEGTRVTIVLEGELTGLRKLLMSGAVAKTMKSEVRSLENLKRILESS
jgi:carbon monoxide dehydrogenase subunit G